MDIKNLTWDKVATGMPAEWYTTPQAAEVAENVLKYQTEIGGWTKNTSYHKNVDDEKWARVKSSGIGATFDNGATLREMRFLAKMYESQKDERYKSAFLKGVEYIFKAQYENGGWPQFFPVRPSKSVSYSSYITFNDDAYLNVMNMLKDIFSDAKELQSLKIEDNIKQRAHVSFNKGIQCILNTQIIVNGKRTVWCAQHDHITLKPAKARAYELPSYSGAESVGLTLLLMSLTDPSEEVIAAVDGSVKWFEEHKIMDLRYERGRDEKGKKYAKLEKCPGAVLWARFYDLDTEKPFVCDRDGIKRSSIDELGEDRRNGYSWYSTSAQKLLDQYPAWKKRVTE